MKSLTPLFLLAALFSAPLALPGLGVGIAYAANADLAGTWVLDKDASESVDAMLKAQGVSFVERKVAAGLDVTQTIAVSGDAITLHIVTSKKTEDQALTADGVGREAPTDQGPSTVSTVWSGDSLVTTTKGVDKKGDAVTMVMTRTLADGGQTLNQQIVLTTATGETFPVLRVFRRQ